VKVTNRYPKLRERSANFFQLRERSANKSSHQLKGLENTFGALTIRLQHPHILLNNFINFMNCANYRILNQAYLSCRRQHVHSTESNSLMNIQ